MKKGLLNYLWFMSKDELRDLGYELARLRALSREKQEWLDFESEMQELRGVSCG